MVSSALWAAAGDALGWMTELADEETVSYRTGKRSIEGTVEWKRRIGGRFGPTVVLPAGTYSDDTQLRLSVSRAIRGTGEFDVEAFAKVELPVLAILFAWCRTRNDRGGNETLPSQASLGSRTSFRSARRWRILYRGWERSCLRAQPHVWKSKSTTASMKFAADVLRDVRLQHTDTPIGLRRGSRSFAAHALEARTLPSANKWKDL